MNVIHGIRECPVGRMTLCVTSDVEMEKCVKMKVSTFLLTCSWKLRQSVAFLVIFCQGIYKVLHSI